MARRLGVALADAARGRSRWSSRACARAARPHRSAGGRVRRRRRRPSRGPYRLHAPPHAARATQRQCLRWPFDRGQMWPERVHRLAADLAAGTAALHQLLGRGDEGRGLRAGDREAGAGALGTRQGLGEHLLVVGVDDDQLLADRARRGRCPPRRPAPAHPPSTGRRAGSRSSRLPGSGATGGRSASSSSRCSARATTCCFSHLRVTTSPSWPAWRWNTRCPGGPTAPPTKKSG